MTEYERLMALGRAVIEAERWHHVGSPQHIRAVRAWKRQQRHMGILTRY
jgi:hypothetical protein